LFDAAVQFTSESPDDAVVSPEGREGMYLGSGDGIATGETRARKTPLVVLFGQLLVPADPPRRSGAGQLNLCTLDAGGFIESDDGARIAFDGKGFGLRSPDIA
jgi:hypothetical protein